MFQNHETTPISVISHPWSLETGAEEERTDWMVYEFGISW